MASASASPPYALAEVTLVLGPPSHAQADFADFQAAAARGERVADHAWARHEHEAVAALTGRDGAITQHTLLETMVGGVLQVGTLIADVEHRWVRHADGLLYAALTFVSEDVRPRAAALALQQPGAIEALDALGDSLSALDGRAWLKWSRRAWLDTGGEEQTTRTARVVAQMAQVVLGATGAARAVEGDAPLELLDDLLQAVRLGVQHAEDPQSPLTQELRALRHLDPLRHEWSRVAMDACFLAAQPPERVRRQGDAPDAAGLAYLYLGRERTDRLKADPFVSPRFRGEIAARTFMTAYALHRLAPTVSRQLLEVMADDRRRAQAPS